MIAMVPLTTKSDLTNLDIIKHCDKNTSIVVQVTCGSCNMITVPSTTVPWQRACRR